jgi:perosamine synthetase
MINPRQIIYPSRLTKIILGSIFPKKISNQNFLYKLRQEINIDHQFNILPINKARVGIYLICKYLIKKTGKKKIIIPPLTVFDVVNMIICAGGEPVFVDLKSNTFDVDLNDLEELSKINKDDLCAILVCNYQINTNIKQVSNFCKSINVQLIQDCAISITSNIENKSIVNFSDFSVFSFNLFKFINAIHGGLVISKDKNFIDFYKKETEEWELYNFRDLFGYYIKGLKVKILTSTLIFSFFTFNLFKFGDIKKIKFIQNLSKNDPSPHLKTSLPISYKKNLNNSQIDELEFQIKNLKKYKNIRLNNYEFLNINLKNKNLIKFAVNELLANSSCVNFPIIVKNSRKEEFSKYLYLNNIDHAKYMYRDCSTLKCFKKYFRECKFCSDISKNIILLPIYHMMSINDLKKICNIINDFK